MDETKLTYFGIGNFRVFERLEQFEIAPITILTGKNNSGKSSLIKAILLFAKTIKSTNGLYLEFRDSDLNLGGFDKVKNYNSSDNDDIYFYFDVKKGDTSYTFSAFYEKTGIDYFRVAVGDTTILEISGEREDDNFICTESYIYLDEGIVDKEKLQKRLGNLSKEELAKIVSSIVQFLENSKKEDSIGTIKFGNLIDEKNHFLFNVRNKIYDALLNTKKKTCFDKVLNIDIQEQIEATFLQEQIGNYLINNGAYFIFIPDDLFYPFVNIDFLESVRAQQSMVYKDIDNPKLIDLFKKYQRMPSINYKKGEIRKALDSEFGMKKIFLDSWLREFGIVDFESELTIEYQPGYGYRISIIKNGRSMDLTEVGYGFTQLIPMILKICTSENKIIIIEEPEANLHPALQSKLADFFYKASRTFNIQFIIETHSEYLIRKLQYLTAKVGEDLSPDDTVIYYFFPPTEIQNGGNQIRKIKINQDGSLTNDFGTGFFDEADKIAMTIWNMNNSQKN